MPTGANQYALEVRMLGLVRISKMRTSSFWMGFMDGLSQ